MAPWIIAVLALAALLTSIVSAILGMAGGVMLLAVMLCFMSHGEAIPTHAAVQIFSNGTRVLTYLRAVDRGAVGRFMIGAVPGGGIGLLLLWALGEPKESEPFLKATIGLYILAATFLPHPKRTGKAPPGSWWDFPLMGLAAGAAALTVGAVGPLIAPLFARRDFLKERLIATKAVCQLLLHVVKIPAFLFLRELDVPRLGLMAALMIVAVIPGTLAGARLIKFVSDSHFRIAYRVALTLAGTKILIYDGLMAFASAPS